MIRIFVGVILAQALASGLMWLNQDMLHTLSGWISLVVPIVSIALVTTFWFNALNRQATESRINRMRDDFAKERQRIELDAERAKAKIVEKTHKQISREAKRTHAKANFKVGAAMSGAIGFGVLMMFTQFVTAGLVLVTTAGGLLSGYMLRLKRERQIENASVEKLQVDEVTGTHEVLPSKKSRRTRIIDALPSTRKGSLK